MVTTRRRTVVAGAMAAVLWACASPVESGAQGLGAVGGDPGPVPRESRLGPEPGAGANPMGSSPGAGESVLEGRLGSPGPRFIPEPFPQVNPGLAPGPPFGGETVAPPRRVPVRPPAGAAANFGLLALPAAGEDEGPADALTLDQAIDRLLRCNRDLYSKSFEIPQAEADILTAGLRANPVLYTDVQLVPYGAFSPNRPGGQTQYDLNVTYPFDLTGKRQARTLVACRAKKVVQAQFQDAVRLQVDNLYTEFVDVLASRETVAEARKGVAELKSQPAGPADDRDLRLDVQREAAEVALVQAEEQHRSDLRTLGALLKMTPAESERLQVRGSLHDTAPPPGPPEALLRLALTSRPDLVAFRLGLGRAEADVKLALANRYPDVFVLYQPYTFQDNTPIGRKSAHSWGAGVALPLPIFNRNQGNIQRARLNVAQSQAELAEMEDQVVFEVNQAERFYAVTRAAVSRIERSLLPRARAVHDRAQRLYLSGRVEALTFLTAERDYDLIVRQYRDALVQHRRSMLRLNTAVGQRVLP